MSHGRSAPCTGCAADFRRRARLTAPARPVAGILRAPGRTGGTRTPVPLIPNEVAWPLAHSSYLPDLVRPGNCKWHIQLSFFDSLSVGREIASVEGIEPSERGFGIRLATIAHRREMNTKKKPPWSVDPDGRLLVIPGITQAGRHDSGSACRQAHRRGCTRARIAGTRLRRRRASSATPAAGSAICRTRCLP